ncbi:uncharacterized protein K452DRAFT_290007 [Aplosporella prunicola CBS 121167]|uniref:Uncharacterized protein n=1 Tax=Aplosporella prunicola CBS 121167 TaxID=1176127 RepID=A0A6A6B614_9PEZI|nr:uncharacterized protein K452DRAFT_290007 [Aplosporella prunicola CBS 121167]KAF2139450.1 hypothetical protein K452DRAFT_290007 [Aplosporella prunicola CBS 121167]
MRLDNARAPRLPLLLVVLLLLMLALTSACVLACLLGPGAGVVLGGLARAGEVLPCHGRGRERKGGGALWLCR